jgi:hypothetical protein
MISPVSHRVNCITNSPRSETIANKVHERTIKRNVVVPKDKTLDAPNKHRGFEEEIKYEFNYCCIGGVGGVTGFFFPKIPNPISPPSIEKIG